MGVNAHDLIISVFFKESWMPSEETKMHLKKVIVISGPHHLLFGDQMYAQVEDYPMLIISDYF